MEYTKGPWVCDVNGYSEYTVYSDVRNSPRRVAGGINNRFDAHLIAAAPDMYEALTYVAQWYSDNIEIMPVAFQTVVNEIEAALAKAGGN